MSAADWAELRSTATACRACAELAESRSTVVFGQWPVGAEVVLVGEAPGADEDATGEPFVGRSGQLLDRLLATAGLPRATVAVVNVLKCRPPGNRKPRAAELARCRGWLDRQLDLIDPLVVVPLGGTATESLLGRGTKVTVVRGHDRVVADRLAVASYHPSAALRFGPAGAPIAALGADLAYVARRAADLRAIGARLRRAVPADAPGLHAAARAAYGALPHLDPPSRAARETVQSVAADLAAEGGVVARDGGDVVGGVRFAGPRPGSAGDARWVRRLAVRPDHQRRGIGRELMRWAEAAAATDGYGELRLGVRTALPGNLTFYERLGYRVVAEHGFWLECAKELP